MAEAITSLTLKIDVQSVDEANRKLDDFSKTAENAASATDDFSEAQRRSSNMTAEQIKDFNRVYQNALKGVKATRAAAEEERKLATVRKQLSESGDKLYVSFRNQLDSLRDVNTASKELERVKSSLNKSYKSGQIDVNNYSQLLSDIAIKSKEVTTAETIATKAKTDFINKLKEQLVTQNMTKEQLLKYRAAQLGVSSSADVYIKKINQARQETQKLGTASLATKHQIATMSAQLMRGNFSGLQTSSMSMIMKNGIGNTFSSLLTSLNPVNIGISALVGFLGSMIPKLFESESATDKLAAAQERLNRALNTDKSTGLTFLSDEMTQLLKKSPSLVKALLRNAEKDAQTTMSSIKTKFQQGFKDMESFLTEYPIMEASNSQSDLDSVLQQIQRIKESGQDLNAMFKSTDRATFDAVIGIQGKIEAYAEYFGITKEQAQDLLVELSDIKSETDSIKAEEKITQLIEKVSQLYLTTGGNNKFESFINGLKEIATQAGEATFQLKFLRLFANDPSGGTDPKKSPFYQYRLMSMSREQRIEAELAKMKADAERSNQLNPGSVTQKDIDNAAAAIRARNSERGSSATSLLHTSQQQEISLMAQLKALREQSLTINTITSERKKYFDLQAQIQVLESTGDKSKLSAQEKYVLSHKEALLAQYAKNAAIGDEIAQYETATKALRKMQEYATNLSAKAKATQATFGMTSKNTNRYNEMSELDAQRDIALKGTSNPNEIAKVTEEYNKAKQALQQSWQQEDINQGDWITGLKVGIEEYEESAKNVFSSFRDFSQQSLNSVSSAMTDFVMTGKMNFNSLTKSILRNIIEIINKMLVVQTIEAALGWMNIGGGGGGKATGGLQPAYSGGYIRGYAGGGSVGEFISSVGFTGRGNKYEPAGIVHKGEFVFTKEATKRIGVNNLYELMNSAQKGYADGGYVNVSPAPIVSMQKSNKLSGGINVTTNVAVNMASGSAESSNANVDPKQLDGQMTAIIQKEVNETIVKLTSPGGAIYNLIRSR